LRQMTPISRGSFCRSRQGEEAFPSATNYRWAGEQCRRRAKFDPRTSQKRFATGACDREDADDMCREPVGHGRRRSVSCSATSGTWCAKASTSRWGEDTDRLILGLALPAGSLAVDRGDLCLGRRPWAPLRAGLTLVKDARKGSGGWARGSRNGAGPPRARQNRLTRRGQTVSAIKGRVPRREGRRAGPSRQGTSGRVSEKAGNAWRASDTLRIAEGPKDVARAARLCGVQGAARPARSSKCWGRGALLLVAGAFDLTLWVFGAPLGIVRLSVVDQGHHRTPDPVVARSQEGAAVCNSRWRRGFRPDDRLLNPNPLQSGGKRFALNFHTQKKWITDAEFS